MLMREFLLYFRNPATCLMPLLFFALVCLLFPLGISPESKILAKMGVGVIWVAVLLAHLIALPKLFEEDYQDGSLDQFLIYPGSLVGLMMRKIYSHWLVFILPMILISPIMGLLFDLSAYSIEILTLSLLLGTPILCIQGAIISALCVGQKNGALLLAILLLPLYIPTLIFGSAITLAAGQNAPIAAPVALLSAILVLSVTLGPSVVVFALRTGIEYS